MPEQIAKPISLDETAMKILWAASERFLHYGYGKTTMSEIAADCNMSTGNLYRYFASKLDIAEAFVRVLRTEQIGRLLKIADRTDLPPSERLRAFMRAKLQVTYERFHDRPKAFELSNEILAERPKLATEWAEAEAKIITGILTDGEKANGFKIADKARDARIIQGAVYKFTSPAVYYEGDYDALAAELEAVMDFILDAYAWQASQARAGKLKT